MSQYGTQQYGQDDPSAGQYGTEQQDPSQGGYGGQEDPNSQQDGYENGQEQDGQQSNRQMQKPRGRGAMLNKQPNGAEGAMTEGHAEIDPRHAHYDPSHYNALHHVGKVASKCQQTPPSPRWRNSSANNFPLKRVASPQNTWTPLYSSEYTP